ncbi:MAG: gamma-glutamyltransferase family protein [Armatimonadota bacterium]|jgi:gamma-glutamyltranspeptidase/glutathione hydrolase
MQGLTGRLAARGYEGAVATGHPLATRAGIDMLRAGGNATDAAVAAAATMVVAAPHLSHLGGDLFLLHYDGATGEVTALNASGAAPRRATLDSYPDGSIRLRGFRSTTVPGLVGGWDLALRLFGTRHRQEVLSAAIAHAEFGFPVGRNLAAAIRANADTLSALPPTRDLFLPDGRPVEVGKTLTQTHLAGTLRAIAIGGATEFYRGGLASIIAEFMAASGGDLDAEDLAAFEPAVGPPLSRPWRGYDLHVQPPVSQAHVMLEAMMIAEPLLDECEGPLSPEWLHGGIEAIKLAYADRHAYAGDPRATGYDPQQLLRPERIAARRAELDRSQAKLHDAGPLPASDTTQLAVVDRQGNAVCLIQSLFHNFGCGVMVPGTGILLNNRLTGFTLQPGHPNCLAPGKRPIHTLTTYMATKDGRVALLGGSPGGMNQVQTNLQTCAAILGFGVDPQVATELPRWFIGDGLLVTMEDRLPPGVAERLRELGHDLRLCPPLHAGGCAQIIARDCDGLLAAGSDPRGDGHADVV